eukprot:TRINITY_DN51096_c0_g1_i1.p1 TRINITY_DN51096_c0_g1~~TRINITY_DN51096_c0_g1_i1.p1  ORF type:complete len:507 (-),score=64.28 TRINITY_DN51096_c0_g1_i1:469-1788(-)
MAKLPPAEVVSGFGKRAAISAGATAASARIPRLTARRLASVSSDTTTVAPKPFFDTVVDAPNVGSPIASKEQSESEVSDAETSTTYGSKSSGYLAPLKDTLEGLQSLGMAGHAATIVVFVLWVLFTLPLTPMEIAVGFIYGAMPGAAFGLFCKSTGSCTAFVLGRRLGRRCGLKMPEVLNSRLALIRSRPVLAVIGVRLMPVPLVVKNYGLGLCDLTFFNFCLGAFAVDLPFSIIWASTGNSCRSLSEALNFSSGDSSEDSVGWVLLHRVLPIALLLLVVVYFAWGQIRPSNLVSAVTDVFEGSKSEEVADCEIGAACKTMVGNNTFSLDGPPSPIGSAASSSDEDKIESDDKQCNKLQDAESVPVVTNPSVGKRHRFGSWPVCFNDPLAKSATTTVGCSACDVKITETKLQDLKDTRINEIIGSCDVVHNIEDQAEDP